MELPAIYEPGTPVIIHGLGNLDEVTGKVYGVHSTMQMLKGDVAQFIYNVELANGGLVRVPDKNLSRVERTSSE
jgi:hypothetical protein